MFGLGWQEILVILVIAVLVIGPEQLPQVARTLGKLMAQFRRVTNELRDTINREVVEQEEFKEFREFGRSLDDEARKIGHVAQDYVEKEVAHEEAEFKRLEQELVRNDGDPGPLNDPEPTPPVAGEPASSTSSSELQTDIAASADGDVAPTKDDPARKETA
jgi:Tat protein translocase TatB subunit